MQSAAASPAPFSTLTVIRRRRENPVGLLVDIARTTWTSPASPGGWPHPGPPT